MYTAIAVIIGIIAFLLIFPWLGTYLDRFLNWADQYPPLKWWAQYMDWVWSRQEKVRVRGRIRDYLARVTTNTDR